MLELVEDEEGDVIDGSARGTWREGCGIVTS
jgi:hypothetical protein